MFYLKSRDTRKDRENDFVLYFNFLLCRIRVKQTMINISSKDIRHEPNDGHFVQSKLIKVRFFLVKTDIFFLKIFTRL